MTYFITQRNVNNYCMTKKLEELLDLPEVKEAIDKAEMDDAKHDQPELEFDEVDTTEKVDPTDLEAVNRKLDKIEEALPQVKGLDSMGEEMDADADMDARAAAGMTTAQIVESALRDEQPAAPQMQPQLQPQMPRSVRAQLMQQIAAQHWSDARLQRRNDGGAAVNKTIEKKRKHNAAKDHKFVPHTRRGGGARPRRPRLAPQRLLEALVRGVAP